MPLAVDDEPVPMLPEPGVLPLPVLLDALLPMPLPVVLPVPLPVVLPVVLPLPMPDDRPVPVSPPLRVVGVVLLAPIDVFGVALAPVPLALPGLVCA
jgi:hypothetical protein